MYFNTRRSCLWYCFFPSEHVRVAMETGFRILNSSNSWTILILITSAGVELLVSFIIRSDELQVELLFKIYFKLQTFLIPETCVSGIYCAISQFSVRFAPFLCINTKMQFILNKRTFLYPFCKSI